MLKHLGSRLYYSKSGHFTLVELLVLIALICIASALFMPALQKTLLVARLASCANNQKQFSACFASYADQYNQYMPAPWNIEGRPYHVRDWNIPRGPTDPLYYVRKAAMGLGVFYREGYLSDGNMVLCPDMKGGLQHSASVLNIALTNVYETGEFKNTLWQEALTSTNFVNGVNTGAPELQGQITSMGVWSWPNYVDYYYLYGIASRVSGNLPGGRNYHAPNNVQKRIRSPRPYLSCGFPNVFWSYAPHGQNSFNALYADGVVQRIPLTDGSYEILKAVSPVTGFRNVVVSRYPNYQPPQ